MSASVSYLAVDLGASSGRIMNCNWDGDRFSLEEIHRFSNGGVRFGLHLYWDVLRIWSEIQSGLKKFNVLRSDVPAGIGVDAWGVDYCLLDNRDRLLGNPYHYRDARTDGMPVALLSLMTGRAIFQATGGQTMEINTSYQLASMVRNQDRMVLEAQSLLMIPDLFAFLLSGVKKAEFTEATTTQLFDLRARCWSHETIARLQLPAHIFQEVVLPGTILGDLLPCVQTDCGFSERFPCIAVSSHDTASAVAAIPGLDDESVFLSSGTWSLLGVVADEPNFSDEFFYGGFTNEGSADGGVLLLKNMLGLWILQECVRMWDAIGKHYTWDEVEEAAKKATPFRSFIDPEAPEFQSPSDMRVSVQTYCSRGAQFVPEDAGAMARCVFESLSFAYRTAIESLERITGRKIRTIRIVGGGALNHFLCQMTANACGRQVIAGPVEATALGNAIVQAMATGRLKNFSEGQEVLERSVPFHSYSPAGDEGWEKAYESFKWIVASQNARSFP